MTEQEALERLHAALPPEFAISVTRNTLVYARMNHPQGRPPYRRVPIEPDTSHQWGAACFLAREDEGDVVLSGGGADLEAAVEDLVAKFNAWRADRAAAPRTPAAPPRLSAPGAAERQRLEEQERQRRERDAS